MLHHLRLLVNLLLREGLVDILGRESLNRLHHRLLVSRLPLWTHPYLVLDGGYYVLATHDILLGLLELSLWLVILLLLSRDHQWRGLGNALMNIGFYPGALLFPIVAGTRGSFYGWNRGHRA